MINFFYKKMIRTEMSNKLKNFGFSKIYNNKNEVINELTSIKYLLESIQEINNDELKFQIKQKLNVLSDIAIIFKKINNEFTEIENSKKKDEEKIRSLYKEYFCVKIENEALKFKNENLIQKENEYELLKEKTGAIFCNGKIICNERKDNEIIILRTENSLLKNEIKKIEDLLLEKNNIINHLNDKIIKLNTKIENLQKIKEEKYPSFSNINININELKHDNYKLNSKDSAFVNTIEVFSSNKNINQKENSTNVFPSYKSNHKLMNKINKGKKKIIERNNYSKPNLNDISSKNYISVNKSLFSSKIKNNTKEKEQIQTNKIRSNYLINSPINKKSEKFSIEEMYKIPTIPNKNVIISQSNKIHKKNNSGQFLENSLKKLIIHDKNHSVLTESKRYNNIFPGFRIRNKNKIKEQNSKKNNSLPSTIFHSLTKTSNKYKNSINKNVVIDYMTPYTTRVSLKKRNENIINDFIKDNSLNLMHSSLLNRTNEDKSLYNNNY